MVAKRYEKMFSSGRVTGRKNSEMKEVRMVIWAVFQLPTVKAIWRSRLFKYFRKP